MPTPGSIGADPVAAHSLAHSGAQQNPVLDASSASAMAPLISIDRFPLSSIGSTFSPSPKGVFQAARPAPAESAAGSTITT
jgi:hypothetical protein